MVQRGAAGSSPWNPSVSSNDNSQPSSSTVVNISSTPAGHNHQGSMMMSSSTPSAAVPCSPLRFLVWLGRMLQLPLVRYYSVPFYDGVLLVLLILLLGLFLRSSTGDPKKIRNLAEEAGEGVKPVTRAASNFLERVELLESQARSETNAKDRRLRHTVAKSTGLTASSVEGTIGDLLDSLTDDVMHSLRDLKHKWIASVRQKVKALERRRSVRRKRQQGVIYSLDDENGDDEEFLLQLEERRDDVDDNPGPAYEHPLDPLDKLDMSARNNKRRDAVIAEFNHSWQGYVQYAWGSDELKPISQAGSNWSSTGSIGLTILDASTTLALMGIDSEVDRVVDYLTAPKGQGGWIDLLDQSIDMSHFEATIRILGSLISLYQLTGEKHSALLERASEFADRLLSAFDTPSGLPDTTVNFRHVNHSNPKWRDDSTAVSEVGTIQLEYRSLSHLTNKSKYDRAATNAFTVLEKGLPQDQLVPLLVNVSTGEWASHRMSVGALGDSYYEYLLKQFLLTNNTEIKYKILFHKAVRSVIENLLQYTTESHLAYVAQRKKHKKLVREFDHLACFLPGAIALGAQQIKDDEDEEEYTRWMNVAADLTNTCFEMYRRQKTGLSPEFVIFPDNGEFINGESSYLLRPEALESLFYMWRFTKQEKYRDMGWKMFKAIRRWCRIDTGGYSGVRRVNDFPVRHDDLQQSFWLAETLKYAFLLFSDESALNLQEWVLNTEAHPLRISDWDPLSLLAQDDHHHPSGGSSVAGSSSRDKTGTSAPGTGSPMPPLKSKKDSQGNGHGGATRPHGGGHHRRAQAKGIYPNKRKPRPKTERRSPPPA